MEYLAVLLPSIGLGVLFWLIMRWILRADSRERRAQAAAEEDARTWYEGVRRREGDDAIFSSSRRRDDEKPENS
ncbi:hypothetical protein [Rothia kristinae]|uniref:Uncharacterized protein n=1 Tax=Rothia kristinae TaxID=37923 RepID=A0A147E2K8_9MICC|nr:hypothetical protein [Rothia kristinae]SIL62419.1 Uncharacterised protein [Mycobacteroides abscessus subsp. abscessus]KTR38110.1 hypothetical protein RSA5_05660 [Rothia kristinae]KTR59913.1 hypothetical protein SA11R_02260 [Rothia kristinae]KTR68401.1 hypothetical protein SA12R_04870 [Rothia kristinae]KTR74233.1 hypothetical protein SA15R_01050 [Rothia kristinae]